MQLNGQYTKSYREELKPHQYQDLYDEEELPLGNVQKGALRMGLYGGSIVVMLMLLAAGLLPIPLEQNFTFVLKASQQEEIYRFPQPIYVLRSYVKAGEKVTKNTSLATITSPQIVQLITTYHRALQERKLFYEQDTLLYTHTKNSFRLRLKELELTIVQQRTDVQFKEQMKAKELEMLRFNAIEAQRRYQINQDLFKQGYISELELKDSQKESVQTQSEFNLVRETYERELAGLKSSLERLAVEREFMQQQVAKVAVEQEQKEQSLQNACRMAEEQILYNYGPFEVKDQALLLKSPGPGEVTLVFDANKEVPAGTILLKIRHKPSSLYALATVTPDRVAYLSTSQPVVLKVNTFPHYEWGVVRGKVQAVSTTPDTEGNYPFEVAITDTGRMGKRLQVGMNGHLSILVEEKTLIELLFQKAQQVQDKLVD